MNSRKDKTEWFGQRAGITPALDPQLHNALVTYGYRPEQAADLIEQSMDLGRYSVAQILSRSVHHFLRYYPDSDSFMLVTDGLTEQNRAPRECAATAGYLVELPLGGDPDHVDEDATMRTCLAHLPQMGAHFLAAHGTVQYRTLNPEAGFTCELADLYPGPQPAPGQGNDNYVYKLACGHDWDSPHPRATASWVNCSVHGATTIMAGDE